MAIESHGAAPSAAAEPNRMRDLLRQATVEIRQLRAQLEAVERQVTPRTAEPIAIIGMACRYPGGADTPEAYWRLLENGVDAIGEVPSRAWDIDRYHDPDPTRPGTMYVRHGGFLDQVDQFDPQFFGIAPREADRMDPQQRLLLEVTHEALEHAGLPAFDLRGSATGVFVGVCFDDYAQRSVRSGDPTRIDAHSSLGTNRSIAAGRIAYVFGLQGPTLQLDTTCSSSLLAVHLACQSLRDGEATLALAGGVNLMLSPEATIGFCRLGALAPDGRCRTFDAAAQGYARGEGCGIVVLKKLSAALADGDRVLAVVRGSAVNHDGASNGLTAPSGPAQTAVIRAALQRAGLQPADVQYVEAHGTATPLGDPIEVMALNDVFAGRATPLLIGSVKTNFGHLEGAAGVAGLMKLVLSLQHRQIPAHLHFATPSPRIPWARLPFTVPTALTEWPATAGPRRGGVSSFGMSGTNVHLIVEEAPPSRPAVSATVDRPLHVLAVSARSPAALAEQVARYRDALGEDGVALADLCFSANTGRSHFALRRAWVAADGAGLRDQLDRAAATPSTEVGHRAAPRIAFLFTGQGAQYVQMGRALYERAPVFRDAIDRCAAIVDPMLQRPLRSVLYPDGTVAASADIDATVFTQPALFALQYALTALWRSWGVAPQIVVGHSVGEYAAAVEAGIVDLPQALGLLAARARLMHALPTAGGMAAVRASREDLAALLPESVEIAACNGPAHTVIAGPSAALGAALNALEARGLPTTRLAVSHGFHSALMAPMQPAFRRHADAVRFGAARIDFISSMTGGLAGAEAAAAGYWVDQIRQPVAFMDAMATLDARGCDVCIEIGPQPVLLALAQGCLGGGGRLWLPSLRAGGAGRGGAAPDWERMLTSLAALYEAGVPVDWSGFDAGRNRRRVDVPRYPFQRRRHWLDAVPVIGAPPAADRGADPLPGRPLPLAGDAIRVFEAVIDGTTGIPWSDHRVFESTLFPAAGYLCLAMAAGHALSGHDCQLRGVTLAQGLWLPEEGGVRVQTAVHRQADGQRFELHSAVDAHWTLHAEGDLVPAPRDRAPSIQPPALAHLPDRLAAADFYARFAARGIRYGAAFRVLDDIAFGPGEALARLTADRRATAALTPDPVLVDAGLQLTGLVISDDRTRLPRSVDAFAWFGAREAVPAWVRARCRDGGDEPSVDIEWFADDGTLLGWLRGLRLVTVAARPVEDPMPVTALYDVAWPPQPLASTLLRSPDDVRERTLPRWAALLSGPDVVDYQRLQPDLEASSVTYAAHALRRLGWNALTDRTGSVAQLAVRLGVEPSRQPLFARCVAMLAGAGVAPDEAAAWPPIADIPLSPPPADGGVAAAPESVLLRRCGNELDAILQGRVDPLQLLFPGGDPTLLTALYEASAGARVMNALLQEALRQSIATPVDGRPLRVLEIGAGTGGTTAHLLPMLASIGPVDYVFSDVSAHFVNAARTRFAGYPFIRCTVLDIEQPETASGLDPAGFDVIVAANVLHATADLERTLRQVHTLLAPGGLLLLLEATTALRWLDLVFGTMPGWWKFTDVARRPAHPLLSVAQWQALLRDTGFEQPQAVQGDRALVQSVLIARRPSVVTGSWLVIGDDASAVEVADGLRDQGASVMRRATAADAVPPDADGIGRVVVVLPSTVVPDAVPETVEGLCRQALELVQTVSRWPEAPRLYFAGQTDDATAAVAHSALWGFVQSANLEHPELQCTAVFGATVDDWLREFAADRPETQVRVVDGVRRVARLRPAAMPATDRPQRLVTTAAGSIASLAWHAGAVVAPAAGQVRLRVRATGVNFRDVLIAMGQYPDPAALGCECVGEVVAIGVQVERFAIGDRVMALAPHGFDSQVTVDQALVVAVPAGVDDASAASLPVAFGTAAHGLLQLARLQPGERVLIHAGTGGVGQAAIQIAQAAGAEIVATASRGKWAALERLGVQHVMDSRTPAFADEILRITDGRGVDVVLSAQPGELQRASLAAVQPRGRFIDIGKGAGLTDAEVASRWPDLAFHRVDLSALCRDQPAAVQALLEQIVRQVDAGHWKPLPVTRFTRDAVVDAFRTVQQARHVGKVVVVDDVPPAPAPEVPRFRSDATYLITGGLGGLGSLVARWMVERGARHLMLLGRSVDAGAEAVRALRADGVRVHLRAVDVADRAALARVMDDIAAGTDGLPPLRGVVHAAGVLEDALLQQLPPAGLSRVLAPKVAGGWHLHTLTAPLDLDCFVLFASAAGMIGAPGQANHGAANAFLDGLARFRRGLGLPALSIDWGAWSGVGSALRYRHNDRVSGLPGVGFIAPQDGLDWLDRVWHRDGAEVGVLPIAWDALLAKPRLRALPLFAELAATAATVRTALPAAAVPAGGLRDRLLAADAAQRARLLDDYVCAAIAQTLGFAPAELDRRSGFFDLGLDSLTALELKNRLQTDLGIVLPATLVFDYPTTDALLAHLQSQFAVPAAEPASIGSRDAGGGVEAADATLPPRVDGRAVQDLLDDRLDALDRLLDAAPAGSNR